MMNILPNTQIIYHSINTSELNLDQLEWTQMIHDFIYKLDNFRLGQIFLHQLIKQLKNDHHLVITNKDDSITIYPKFHRLDKKHVIIVVPSTPYFVSTARLRLDARHASIHPDLINLCQYHSIKDPIDPKLCQNLLEYHNQPILIQFIHELIHCLRAFKGLHKPKIEEAATIYGLSDYTLKIHGIEFTENTLNEHYGLLPRISHESQDIYVLDDHKTHDNRVHFTKHSFYTFGWK